MKGFISSQNKGQEYNNSSRTFKENFTKLAEEIYKLKMKMWYLTKVGGIVKHNWQN